MMSFIAKTDRFPMSWREGVKITKGVSKVEGLDWMHWLLSYDVFVEVSNTSEAASQDVRFVYRQEKSWVDFQLPDRGRLHARKS